MAPAVIMKVQRKQHIQPLAGLIFLDDKLDRLVRERWVTRDVAQMLTCLSLVVPVLPLRSLKLPVLPLRSLKLPVLPLRSLKLPVLLLRSLNLPALPLAVSRIRSSAPPA